MKDNIPDFNNIVDGVYRRKHPRIPLYEHIIDPSVPDYMPVENYIAMVETAREFRERT